MLRTSWVFSATGRNFVRSILAAVAKKPRLEVVADQSGRPTAADDLAAACLAVAAMDPAGPGDEVPPVLHFGGDPPVTWYDFAAAIVARAGRAAAGRPTLVPVATACVPRPAQRPTNGVLDCDAYIRATGCALPDWRPALDRVMARLTGGEG